MVLRGPGICYVIKWVRSRFTLHTTSNLDDVGTELLNIPPDGKGKGKSR